MIRIMRSTKSVLSKKDLNNLGLINLNEIDITKSPEENLSSIIINNVYNDKIEHLIEVNLIYDLLIKIQSFREFILLNDLDKKLVLEMLKSGILHQYKKDEIIYKKETYPKFYFIILAGTVSFLNSSEIIIKPGNFLGNEIIQRTRYKQTSISTSDKTVLLSIPKAFIISNIIDKIILANERIQKVLENSFPYFKTIDRTLYFKYCEKMIKLFPKVNETIISNKEVADAIFIIYNGICVLNFEENQDLIKLDKGDIVGSESLANLDENGNIMNYKYLYNLVNKANNTIIFKFFIKDFNKNIINELNDQLSAYFLKREAIIQKNELMQKFMKRRLMKNYNIFKKKENINEYISKSMIKDFTPEKAENSFNQALNKIRSKENFYKDKQKLILRGTCINKDNIIKNNLFKKFNANKSSISLKEINLKEIKKKYTSLSNLIKIGKINQKSIISDYKKSFENSEEKNEEINIIDKNDNMQKNSASSIKNKNTSLEGSNNNSFFFTAVKSQKNIYKKINIVGNKKESILFSSRLKKKKISENISIPKIISLIPSLRKDSFSSRTSRFMSAKKQIETYGCPVIDTMNYFNYGEKKRYLKMNKSELGKKCLFYETLKFNIPLFIFCRNKENII